MSTALATLGAAFLFYQLCKASSFVQLHFLHRSRLERYRDAGNDTSEPAWALVTGATDGIGRAFAEELCERGFNVIIHGRNEQKLQNLKTQLTKQWPKQAVRMLQVDAGKEPFETQTLERGLESLQDLTIKVLVNNVGGSGGIPSFTELENRTPDEVVTFLNINSRFPTEITRALLPRLRRSSPAVIINIGSVTSEFGLPYLSVYSGCKSYNKAWSKSLTAEMKAENNDIEVLLLVLSAVATDNYPKPRSLFVPSAKQLAKAGLDKVGCGTMTAYAYWPHELQASLLLALPEWIAAKLVIDVGKQEKAVEDKRQAEAET